LSPEKGVDVLIKAVVSMVNRGYDVTLVIIGEGNERPRLTQLISNLNLSDRVFLIGYYDKAFCFLPYFDVFVLPSYTEGFPITLLEAMQAGTPIVATRVGEVPAVLDGGRFGRLVPPGDPEALAKGIEEVYSNRQEAKQRSVGAQERVLMEYGVEKMVQRYVDLYHTVIHRKGEVN
jgi:glycosyltransferase involved in cell wall biosynthesis